MTKQKKKSKPKKQPAINDAQPMDAAADEAARQLAQTSLDDQRRRREAERSKELSRELCASRHEGVEWCEYEGEVHLPEVMKMVDNDLSEPYSIFTYRYFVKNWPSLCLLARINGETVACVVSKAEVENSTLVAGETCYRGYIAMLAVNNEYRRTGIGTALVCRSIERMRGMGCQEVILETETTNLIALSLYEKLGFARDERLFKYYLNGADAFRLCLPLARDDVAEPPLARVRSQSDFS
jgi:peptide alpha-N-acetyltransferase